MIVIAFCPKSRQAELQASIPGGGWGIALVYAATNEIIGFWCSWYGGPQALLTETLGDENVWVDVASDDVLDQLSIRFGSPIGPYEADET